MTNIAWVKVPGEDGQPARKAETWNLVTGCTPCSAACLNCYAARMAGSRLWNNRRYYGLTGKFEGRYYYNGIVRYHDDLLDVPLHWRDPRTVFVCSMSDLFHPNVPFRFLADMFNVICDKRCEEHTFQILTKRPKRIMEFLQWCDKHRAVTLDVNGPLSNLWLGTTVENQEMADKRIPELLKCLAVVRFLSCEPLISAVDLSEWLPKGGHYDRRRNVVSRPNGARMVLCQNERNNLEDGQIRGQRASDDAAHKTTACRTKHQQERGLSESLVSRKRQTEANCGTSDCLDGEKSGDDSTRDGNESQRWHQGQQSSIQSRTGDAERKRQALLPGVGQKTESSKRRTKCQCQIERGASAEDKRALEEQKCLAAKVGNDFRCNADDDIGDRNTQKLGPFIDWVIVGAETGPHARPMKLEWAFDIQKQCRKAGIAFFFKQGSPGQVIPPELNVREWPR